MGYYHADEHYQIIEFAGTIDDTVDRSTLAWEYEARIRSSLQPVIAHLVFQVCDLFSISNNYTKAIALRLLTALLALFCIHFFTRSCKKIIRPKYWTAFLLLSYFLWFLPFINVRFSSETWSGLILLLVIGMIIKDKDQAKIYLLIGLLMGLSFLFRFQIAFAGIGIVLWLVFIRKVSVKNLLLTLLGGGIMLLIGFILDSWFYGTKTLTAVEYIRAFIIGVEQAGATNKSPFYYIFYLFRYPFFPIGICILFGIVFTCIKRKRDLLTWTIIPFVIIHSIISHKELRFLFPLVNLLPLIFILAYQELKYHKNVKLQYVRNGLFVLLATINIIAVTIASVKPAGIGQAYLAEYIDRNYNTDPITLYQYNKSDPVHPWGLRANFYHSELVQSKDLRPILEANTKIGTGNLLVLKQKDINNEAVKRFITAHNFQEASQSIPQWMNPFLRVYGFSQKEMLVLFTN